MSLPKAISAVEKIFAADKRNPVDREVAARHIGYTGKSGASDKALAALAHFGLTERVGKGAIRVSQLAMDILHPDPSDPRSRERSLYQAGMRPDVYKELRKQFPEQVSEDTLRSYLLRMGFNSPSLPAAMSAYFETLRFLEKSKAFESGGVSADDGPESDLQEEEAGADMEDESVIERPRAAPSRQAVQAEAQAGETEWMRNLLGRETKVRLLVTGDMGPREIGRLIKLLEAQRAVLTDEDED
jgi:hypothetical protein